MSDITIEGVDEVVASLKTLVDEEKVGTAIGKACALLERAAKEKAPKNTGELRRSITSEVNGYEGKVFTSLFYAPYIEYGTGLFAENNGGRQDVPWRYKDKDGNWVTTYGIHPQPFMRPAADENREEVLRILGECVKND